MNGSVAQELILVPPDPVPPISGAGAAGMVRIDPAACARLEPMAADFVESLIGLEPRGEAFERKLESIRTMGQDDIRRAAGASNRMLELPVRAMESGTGSAGSTVSTSLADLRRTVEDLDPSRRGVLQGARRRALGVIPLGDRVRSYFARYVSAQRHLDGVIEALHRGQDELRRDNAAIDQEKATLWATMGRLREYAYLAQAIDAELEARIAAVEAGDPERAAALRSDVQFSVRQRLQDLLTQLAVSVQGYLAMDMVRRSNLELVKGVDRATTTTVSALRTAVIVAQALGNQRLVLRQISALQTTTGTLVEATSEMLRDQTAEIHAQAAGTTIGLEQLQAAFANVYAAIDSIDSYRLAAVDSMRQTVATLSGEVERAQRYLDRTADRSTPAELALPAGGHDAVTG